MRRVSPLRYKLFWLFLPGVLAALLAFPGHSLQGPLSAKVHAAGEYGTVYIDVLPDPANTTTSFGAIELCRDTDDGGGPLDVDDTFTIHVAVGSANDLAGPQWVLNYSSTHLQVNSYNWASWKMGTGGQDASDSMPDTDGTFSTSYDQTYGVDDDGVLQAIVFQAKVDGTSDLTLSGVDLVDSGGTDHYPPEVIVHDYPGSVRVSVGEACSADSDGDTVFDTLDNCPETANPDQADFDDDDVGDACDNCPETANADQADFDGDGVPGSQPPPGTGWGGDACDANDDNDMIADDFEPETCHFDSDCDDDTYLDGIDNCILIANPGQADNDGDFIPGGLNPSTRGGDACDTDDDNDGILDDGDGSSTIGDNPCTGGDTEGCDDNCQFTANADQANPDYDSLGDVCDNCPDDYNPDQTDYEGDGLGDVCDPDDDNDTILDDGDGSSTIGDNPCTGGDTEGCDDNCQFTPNADQANPDYDSLGDVCDNCPDDYNPDQADYEGDGLGDVCDPDDDNDTILDDGDGSTTIGDNPCTGGNTEDCDDNCQFTANADQANYDGDSLGDVCDPDDDNDSLSLDEPLYFRDEVELFMGTDPLDECADTSTANDETGLGESPWPPDFNDNGRTDIGDLVLLKNHWVPLGNPYDVRYDLNANGGCDIGDLVILKRYWVGSGYDTCSVG